MFRTHTGQHNDPDFNATGIFEDEDMEDMVCYSLNKRRRWELPGIIEELILNDADDDYADAADEIGIQLVQRHNIFQIANCVRLAATESIIKDDQIQIYRLFHNSSGFFQSNSLLYRKHTYKKDGQRESANSPRLCDTDKGNSDADKSVADANEFQKNANKDEELLEKPAVRYEVVLPTPDISYLAHNKKSVNKPEHIPYRRGLQFVPKKQKKRTYLYNNIQDALEEWVEDHPVECDYVKQERGRARHTIYVEDLLKHVNKADRKAKKKNRKYNAITRETSTNHPYTKHKTNHEEKEPLKLPTVESKKRSRVHMHSVKVILPSKDTIPQRLAKLYKNKYIEAECSPRTVLLNISNKILSSKTNGACVFLVLMHDFDNDRNTLGNSVFHVIVNAHFADIERSVKLHAVKEYSETTIEELIDKAMEYFKELPEDTLDIEATFGAKLSQPSSQVEICANWSTKSYHPSSLFLIRHLCTQTNSMFSKANEKYDSNARDVNENVRLDEEAEDSKVCDICLEEVYLEYGTVLKSCSHWFCDDCLREHIYTQIDNNATTLQCPQHRCKHRIDGATTLSLVGVSEVLKHARLYHDHQVLMQASRRWCPDEKCGRAIKVNTESVSFAHCVCGKKFCMQCMGDAHWPATCEAVKRYRDKLKRTGDGALVPEENVTTITVNGKNCPVCARFVEKHGGCQNMQCLCGTEFCWGCGQPWNLRFHDKSCLTNGYGDDYGIKNHIIKPERLEDKTRESWYKMAVIHRLKQHPNSVLQLQVGLQSITRKLRNYIVRAKKKGVNVILGYGMDNKRYKTEVDKVNDWIRYIVDIYVEVNEVAENTSLFLGYTQLLNQVKQRVLYILNRLVFCGNTIYNLIINSSALTTPAVFLSQMKEALLLCKDNIRSLVRLVIQYKELLHNK